MSAVRTETHRGITTVTLADAEKRNVLGAALMSSFHDALLAAEADDAVRAVVVTNEGNTFCAGADLKERRGVTARTEGAVGLDGLIQAIQRCAKPVLGRIAGHVVGGGNGLAAAFDLAVAADDAKFAFTEVRLGVVPAIVSVVCLPKLRRSDALELFLRGNRIPAARAAELGLINRAVPRAQLDAAIEEWLDDLLLGGPTALGLAKRLVYEVPALETEDAWKWTSELSDRLFASEEATAGTRAFLSRSRPPWAPGEE